jgi:hypothetical protein
MYNICHIIDPALCFIHHYEWTFSYDVVEDWHAEISGVFSLIMLILFYVVAIQLLDLVVFMLHKYQHCLIKWNVVIFTVRKKQ